MFPYFALFITFLIKNINWNTNLTNGKGKRKPEKSSSCCRNTEDSTRCKGRNNQATVLYIKILNGHKCRPSFNSSPNPVSPPGTLACSAFNLVMGRDFCSFMFLVVQTTRREKSSFPKRRLNEGGSMPLRISFSAPLILRDGKCRHPLSDENMNHGSLRYGTIRN